MGLQFAETMGGTMSDGGAPVPVTFDIAVRIASLRQFRMYPLGEITGEVVMGAGERCPLVGSVEIDLFRKRIIRYVFAFTPKNGPTYRFSGVKHVRWWNPFVTMTTLYSGLFRGGEEVMRGVLHFDLRTLPGFIFSLRWY